jgi:hypothetical protein
MSGKPRRTFLLSSVVWAVLVAGVLGASPAGATDPEATLDDCIDWYWEGRFEEAIARLEVLTGTLTGEEQVVAYEFLARSHVRVGNQETASLTFRALLNRWPDWRPDEKSVAGPEWEAFAQALAKYEAENYGGLEVQSNPPAARLFIDGEPQTLLTPAVLARVPVGPHTVVVEMEGYAPSDTVVTVSPGGTALLEFALQEKGEDAPPRPFWKNRWVQIAGGVLGAGLIYAIASGGGDDGGGGEQPKENLPGFPDPPTK